MKWNSTLTEGYFSLADKNSPDWPNIEAACEVQEIKIRTLRLSAKTFVNNTSAITGLKTFVQGNKSDKVFNLHYNLCADKFANRFKSIRKRFENCTVQPQSLTF